MPFGVTYAVFAALVGLSIVAIEPTERMRRQSPETGSLMISYAQNDDRKRGIGRDGIGTLDYYPENERLFGFKTFYAGGLGAGGGGFFSFGIRKDFYFGKIRVTPFFGPAIHQTKLGDFSADELLQFRTGFDIIVPVNDRVMLSAGFFHLSNAQFNDASGSVDALRIGIGYNF